MSITVKPVSLQGSGTGNNKSGLCWQVAFVRSVRNYLSEFHGTILDVKPRLAGVLMHGFDCIKVQPSKRHLGQHFAKLVSFNLYWKQLIPFVNNSWHSNIVINKQEHVLPLLHIAQTNTVICKHSFRSRFINDPNTTRQFEHFNLLFVCIELMPLIWDRFKNDYNYSATDLHIYTCFTLQQYCILLISIFQFGFWYFDLIFLVSPV